MKKILFTFLVAGSSLFAKDILVDNTFKVSDNCDRVIQKTGFTICYDYKLKGPKWVGYALTNKEVKAYRKRPGSSAFKPDRTIPSKYRSELSDFRGNGVFDRGHMAPNAALDFSAKSQKDTFILSNISPQYSRFNRQIWKDLEENVRKWTKSNRELYVITGVIKGNKTLGKNNVNIPSKFYKVLYSPTKRNGIGFILPHEKNLNRKKLFSFKEKISVIENETGIKYFTNIKGSKFKNFKGYFK